MPSQVVGLAFAAITHQLLEDVDACERCAREVLTLCERYRIGYYSEWGRILSGWCRGQQGAIEIRQGIDTLLGLGARLRMPYWLMLLADVTPDPDPARSILEKAVSCATDQGERWWLPDLWRRESGLLAEHAAMVQLTRAESLAREQGNLAVLDRCRDDLATRRTWQPGSLQLVTARDEQTGLPADQ